MSILNASGGVGSFAVQFAKAKGIKVVGTCSGRNTDFVKDLGAFDVVDYTKKNVVDDVKKIHRYHQYLHRRDLRIVIVLFQVL